MNLLATASTATRRLAAAVVMCAVMGTAKAADPPPLELLAPAELRTSTSGDFVNVLGRTRPGVRVRIGDQEVPVYATGIFVRDRVPLSSGTNRIRVEAVDGAGATSARDLLVERTPTPPPPPANDRLFIDPASIEPQAVHRVAPGEAVDVRLRGTPGHRAEARLQGQGWQPLVEERRAPGSYRATLRFPPGPDTEPRAVQVRLSAPRGIKLRGARSVSARSVGSVGRWSAESQRLVVAGPDGADLLHGLHEVRLGGPYLAELPAGTVLRITGQQGAHYRVRLAADTQAWVLARSVLPAEPDTPLPAPVFTGVSVAGSDAGDVISLPFPAPAPYAVRSVAAPDGRILLEADLFGTHLAATWITQLANTRVVREVTLEQAAEGRVRLRIVPLERRLWGWRVEQTPTALRITLRAPPVPAAAPASPLAGLLVALEAGHGGPGNLGAVGATQVPEKDINRWTTDALKAELEAAGARVVDIREGDDNPNLRERSRRATASGAHLLVSMHANSADTRHGYLRAAGTSVFFKHAASREWSGAVHRRLLETTGLPDFGHIGNFNYAPIRLVTWMPAVLVEQAFVSNPAEEALLLDPAFRASIARAVRWGIEDVLRQP